MSLLIAVDMPAPVEPVHLPSESGDMATAAAKAANAATPGVSASSLSARQQSATAQLVSFCQRLRVDVRDCAGVHAFARVGVGVSACVCVCVWCVIMRTCAYVYVFVWRS